MANIVILKTNRSHYNIDDAAYESMTVGQLIEELEYLDKNSKIVFSNDNGYTYGYITENTIKELD